MPFGYGEFSGKTQAIRNYLNYIDSLSLSGVQVENVKSTKGLIFVWAAAAFEQFWRSYLEELGGRYVKASVVSRRRNISAAGIFYFDSLSSFGDAQKLKRWSKLADFFDELSVGGKPVQAHPHDGKTIRPEHVELIWRIFRLNGSCFPTPIHRQELNTLANKRNEVAHGDIAPSVMGGGVSVHDLRKLISRLEDIVEHCVLAASMKWP